MAAKVTPIDAKKEPAVVPQQVVSVEHSNLFTPGNFERYNPDALMARKGFAIYRRMMNDEQVKAAMRFKQLSVIGRGYEFVWDTTDLPVEEQKKRTAVFDSMLRQMKGTFSDVLLAALKSYIDGYSLQEMVFDNITVEGATYTGLNSVLARDVQSFNFYTDDYGILKRFTQKISMRETELDYTKFLHFVQNPDEDAYYGQSELKAAYRSWFMKDTAIKFWMQWLERMAGGFLAIKLGDSGIAVNSPDYTALQNLLTNLRGAMGVILPTGVEAEMVSPATTDAYQKAVEFHDLGIAKSLLVPNLLGLSNSGQTGAYAQSQTQLETYFITIANDSHRLEQTLNNVMFSAIAKKNWDDGLFPRFRLKKASAEYIKWIIETWQKMVSGNVVIATEEDEAHFRKLMDMPARTEEDEPLVTPAQEQEQANAEAALEVTKTAAAAKGAPAANDDSAVPVKKAAMTAEEITALVTSTVTDLVKPKEPEKKKFSAKWYAMQRVDFSVIAQRTTTIENDAASNVARLAARAVRRLLSDERMVELLDKDTADIGTLAFESSDVGKIKAAWKAMLDRSWSVGLAQAMDEVGKIRKSVYASDVRTVRFADLRGKAGEYFDGASFRMAGNLTDGMKSIIQQELLSAVREGTRPEQAASTIYERLIKKGMLTLEAVQFEEPRESIRALTEEALAEALSTVNVPAYLNTLARTNTFEALNEARYAEFRSPDVADFVEALEFSAIMDDRTTDICTSMDGHIHGINSPVWDTHRPPLHYNCRSVLIAVTAVDGWDGVESEEPTVEPQDGF